MIYRILAALIAMSLAVCTAQPVSPGPTVAVGDASGYVQTVSIKPKDLASVCNFAKFQDGFRYTYMSMWNGRIDKILEDKPSASATAYYKGKIFYAKPTVKATLETRTTDDGGLDSCKANSYEQGTINGFIYALDDLKTLEAHAPQ